ncbi:MAG: hypothetical protein KBT19_05295 [Lachnospiraceae bacterium]|nr:hypothetical protein [Candidatus Colinaster equi]
MKRRLIALGLAVTMLCTTWIQSGMQACAAEASYATESQNELQSTGYEQNVQGEYNPETTDVYEETSGEYSVVEEESETVSVTTEEVDESEPTTETENVTESEESDETIEETVSGDVEDETTETTTEDMHAVESPLTPMPQRIELNQSQISLYEATTGLAGDTYTLSASVYPENWYRRDYYIEWKIYNADGTSPCTIAKLTEEPGGEETGLLRGLDTVNVVSKSLGGAEEAGKAIVTATIYASEDISQTPIVKASCKVTVLPSEAAEDAEEIIDGIWMTGFKESDDAFVYSGAKITQNVSLYDRKMKLTEGKDYTLTYKNNINACDSKQLNSPSMTITMKGKYSGTKVKFFEIKQRDISEAVVEQKDTAYNTNGKMQKYVPTVKYNGKKLTNNKDFKVTYHVIQNGSNPKTFLADEPDNTWINNHKYETVEVFYLLEGQGNFTGKNLLQQRYSDADVISAQMENLEFTGSYLIVPKSNNIANATIKYKSKLSYCGASITPADLDISIKMSGEGYYEDLMDPGPWKITFCDSKGNPIDSNSINAPGSYSFTIEGADLDEYPYAIGKVTKKFTVSAGYQLKNVAKVKAGWQDTIPFNKAVSATIDETTGKAKGMRQIIDDSDCDLLESIDGSIPISTDDYDVVYSNNTKVGTAKITFKGKGKCTGTFTKTYKICGGDFEVYFAPGETVTIGGKAETTYVQGGVSPKVIVAAEDGNELVNKKDYTITYVNNKAVTDEAHVRIKGMGNYVNTERELTYAIKPASIATCTVTVADKAASTKTNDYISPVTVYAPNGKKLVAGKDYQKLTIDDYSFDRKTGSDTPEAGTEITVTITGIGCDKQAPMTHIPVRAIFTVK